MSVLLRFIFLLGLGPVVKGGLFQTRLEFPFDPTGKLVSGQEFQATCGNGEIIDLDYDNHEEFYWNSPGWIDGDQYPQNTE